AASVRPEPGSNSPKKCLTCSFCFLIVCAHLKINVGALFCSVFKEQFVVVSLRSDSYNVTHCVTFRQQLFLKSFQQLVELFKLLS
ncbi:hypothetical protein ACFY5J_28255, partial [Peribacillus butanolivorans]|uniref:hypothetical protein n=1 Tax=Peribacillus butanolivorans TaxID=421767 RepID=UPI003625B78D